MSLVPPESELAPETREAHDDDLAGERAASDGAVANEAARLAPTRAWMRGAQRLWMGLALLAGALLLASLFGLIPAREPPAPPTVAFQATKAVDPEMQTHVVAAPAVHKLLGWSLPICARPRDGARLYRVELSAEREAFAVWCAGEYVLLEVDATGSPELAPRVTRLARFPTRGELPGGATSIDLDLDGVLDLALGVAPAPGVVHRPFSGLFFLRGRSQGGFENARALVEMPVVASAAAELDEHPGAELLVLTRGDVAAQRPGELWVFTGGTSPARAAVVPTGLAPSDLMVGPMREGQNELWVVSTQPGSLVRLKLPAQRAGWTSVLRAELAVPGVQAFVRGPRAERALYVRDLKGARSVDDGATVKLGPALAEAELGPATWLQSANGERALLAATQHGFSLTRGGQSRERTLPAGMRVVDASSTHGGAGQQRGLLLLAPDEPSANLTLVVLPPDLRDEASELELRAGALESAPSEARVALE